MEAREIEARLNDIAVRCFREVADKDYIHARIGFRSGLAQQFLWSSLQAVEKYLKCILLFNRVAAQDVGHNLSEALKRIRTVDIFELELSEVVSDFVVMLDSFGAHRYLESSFYTRTINLPLLDKTVWEIRRYCQKLDSVIEDKNGKVIELLPFSLERIRKSNLQSPHKFTLQNGFLEKVINNKSHPARDGLLWMNAFFGLKPRKVVRLPGRNVAENSPFDIQPEIINEAAKYIFIPKPIKIKGK